MNQQNRFHIFFFCFFAFIAGCLKAQPEDRIIVGAKQWELYQPLLHSKRIAVVANQTSMIDDRHLVDFLLGKKQEVALVFSPEHGFRGLAEAGADIKSEKDALTGLPVVSLYGNRKKPTSGNLAGIDLVLFDLQDVGARFYTYISTLHYVMEACAEAGIPVVVLDRPNPNGFYVDGPVLDTAFRSFVGMHPVPIVHGMTIGEYAQMIKGEKWIKKADQCSLTVIPVKNYHHQMLYDLPVDPSPNLTTMEAIYLYPSLCLFEGTNVSIGRGIDKPFQVYGFPHNPKGTYTFTPRPIKGKSENPPFKNQLCKGEDLTAVSKPFFLKEKRLNLSWLIQAYQNNGDTTAFFIPFFSKLAGNKILQQQIESGCTEDEIRQSWQPALTRFKAVRAKYLLYED